MEKQTLRPEEKARVGRGFACTGSFPGCPSLGASRGAWDRCAEDAGWEDRGIPALGQQRRGERSEESALPSSRTTFPRPR